MATMRSPLRSILASTSPVRPRRTPSGLISTRVRSDNVLPPHWGLSTCEGGRALRGITSIGLPRQSYRRPRPTGRLPPGQDRPKTPAAAPLASTDRLIYQQTASAPRGVTAPSGDLVAPGEPDSGQPERTEDH